MYSSSFARLHMRKDFYSIVPCIPRRLFAWNVCTQANSIADLLTNKLKSFKFGILFLDCVETDHERWLFSLICRIAVSAHATTETDMAILRDHTWFSSQPGKMILSKWRNHFCPNWLIFRKIEGAAAPPPPASTPMKKYIYIFFKCNGRIPATVMSQLLQAQKLK